MAILLVLVLLAGFVFYKGYSFTKAIKAKSHALTQPVDKGNVNVLIVGIDAGKFADWDRNNDIGRTDTIILASYNPKNNNIHLISVPRDTMVKLNGRNDKINAAFPIGGIDQSIKSVSDLLGVPIHHYIQLNYVSFIETVDILDGVTVDVDKDIKNSINIPPHTFTPGVQKIKGKKAFYFVQARNSDLDRIKRQQIFIKAILKEFQKPVNLVKIPQVLDAVKNDIKTDMSASELLSLANKIKKASAEGMQSDMIPGEPQYIGGVSYYVPNMEQINALIKKANITN